MDRAIQWRGFSHPETPGWVYHVHTLVGRFQMKLATPLRIQGYTSHLLSKVTICLSAVTYVTARARTARILYNMELSKVLEAARYGPPNTDARYLYPLTQKIPAS